MKKETLYWCHKQHLCVRLLVHVLFIYLIFSSFFFSVFLFFVIHLKLKTFFGGKCFLTWNKLYMHQISSVTSWKYNCVCVLHCLRCVKSEKKNLPYKTKWYRVEQITAKNTFDLNWNFVLALKSLMTKIKQNKKRKEKKTKCIEIHTK